MRIKTCSRGVIQKIACTTGALWTKRGKHGILREARSERTVRDEGRRKENARLALMQATQKIPLQMKHQSLLTLSSWVGKVWLSFVIFGWKSWFAKWFHQFNPTLFLEPSPPPPWKQFPSLTLEYIGLVWMRERGSELPGPSRYVPWSLGPRVPVDKVSWGYWRKREQIGRE